MKSNFSYKLRPLIETKFTFIGEYKKLTLYLYISHTNIHFFVLYSNLPYELSVIS